MKNRWLNGIIVLFATGCAPLLVIVLAVGASPAVSRTADEIEAAQTTRLERTVGGLIEPRLRPVDEMVTVYVPAGAFPMGGSGERDAAPVHEVILDDFWLDQTEVSNRQHALCVAAGVCRTPAFAPDEAFNAPDQPVVGVSWHDAAAYCEWVGGHLPTEAQWEYAARGPRANIYPWGNGYSRDRMTAGQPGPQPVGSYPLGRSWVEADDMAGNVWEWVADWYDPGFYANATASNPVGPDSGTTKVVRGGDYVGRSTEVHLAYRHQLPPESRTDRVGFRCVRS